MTKATCSADECPNRANCKGLCKTHYGRLWRHGDPRADVPVIPRIPNTEETFWSRVDKNGPVNPLRLDLGPCWLWSGTRLNNSGYGQFGYKGNRREGAHRVAWMMANRRDVPDGTELDHLCHTNDRSCPGGREHCRHRQCVNPAHLEPVPHHVNSKRGVRGNMTTCAKGHELQVLTVRDGRPKRFCPICAESRLRTLREECLAGKVGRSTRRTMTVDLLKEVASIYASALEEGVRPRVAVARHFQRGPDSVSPWIAKAKAAGYLASGKAR